MGIDAQMLVKTRQPFTEQQVRRLAVELAEAFGHDRFWIGEDWPKYDYDTDKEIGRGQHALELIAVYRQDGDDVLPEPGETFIEVHPATRYYGEGYERGDVTFLIAVANWLEVRIPGARLFYGGDSSGVCAEPFGPIERATVWAHFCRFGHRPYRGGFDMFAQPGSVVHCGFCDSAMVSSGGGRDRTFYACVGCGKKAIQHHSGDVQIVPRGKDFFDMRDSEVPNV